jgi:hypothetical protein
MNKTIKTEKINNTNIIINDLTYSASFSPSSLFWPLLPVFSLLRVSAAPREPSPPTYAILSGIACRGGRGPASNVPARRALKLAVWINYLPACLVSRSGSRPPDGPGRVSLGKGWRGSRLVDVVVSVRIGSLPRSGPDRRASSEETRAGRSRCGDSPAGRRYCSRTFRRQRASATGSASTDGGAFPRCRRSPRRKRSARRLVRSRREAPPGPAPTPRNWGARSERPCR